MAADKVRLFPVPGAYLLGYSTDPEGIEVTEVEAKRLLKYEPPVFTAEAPRKARQDGGPADSKEK